MNTDHWILTYQTPHPELGWVAPHFEHLEVPVTLTPHDTVSIERVFHRLSMLALDCDAHARRLRHDLEVLQRRSVWAVLRDALRRGRA